MADMLRGIKKKTDSGYSDFLPTAVDGDHTTMFSSLDLEQELKLGGNHTVEISTIDDITTIVERYTKIGSNQYNVDYQKIQYYQVETTINGNNITQRLYTVDGNGTLTLIKTKTITITDGDTVNINESLS